jgi:hypothetical protein
MHFGKRPRRYNRTLMIANIFMVLATVANTVLIRKFHLAGDLTDGLVGLLYGLTIGCYIVGIRKMMRDDPGTGAGSCA